MLSKIEDGKNEEMPQMREEDGQAPTIQDILLHPLWVYGGKMLNKQKGNMYPFVTHTINFIKGRCPYGCLYCYMKRFPVGDLRLDEKEFKTDLGKGNIIFVGSSVDMWASSIPQGWIKKVLNYCNEYMDNTYLFQSKNPMRFNEFIKDFPLYFILGTTIETDKYPIDGITNAPSPNKRFEWLDQIGNSTTQLGKIRTMVSIEPIMDFTPYWLIGMIKEIKPDFVSIGADSQNCGLPEPSPEKVRNLIEELKKFTEVRIKKNLDRLLEEKEC